MTASMMTPRESGGDSRRRRRRAGRSSSRRLHERLSSVDQGRLRGLAAIVIGNGGDSDAVNLVGDSYAVDLEDTTFNKRVRLYVGDGMNVPAVYHRKNAAISSLRNLQIDGNRAHQTGSAANACGNRLYTVCSEDNLSPKRESGLSLLNVVLSGGYNGSYYLGSGRGGVYLQNIWALGSGKSKQDAQILLNGYDTVIDNPQIANSTGFGVYIGEGTQYQINNGAMWSNHVALAIGASVNQVSVIGTQIGASAADGIRPPARPACTPRERARFRTFHSIRTACRRMEASPTCRCPPAGRRRWSLRFRRQ